MSTLREYLARHLPPSLRSTLSVDDILQDVWVTVYRTYEAFTSAGPDALDRWLLTIAHSRLVDAVRRARQSRRGGDVRYMRDGSTAQTSFAGVMARLPSRGRTPSREAARIEGAHRLLIGLEQLSTRQRRAVVLRYLHGWPPAQIAPELGVTERAVAGLLQRGLLVLRRTLGPAARYFTDARSNERVFADEPAHAQD